MPGTERLLHGHAWGRSFAVGAPGAVLGLVMAELPFGWQSLDPGPVERSWRIDLDAAGSASAMADRVPMVGATTPAAAARLVAADLELWVAEHAEDQIFVHAGVVVVNGRALLLPGRSRAGKSTLVAALVAAGADYFSDEFAPLDSSGMVHPYQRPIRHRPGSPAHAWPPAITPGTVPDAVPVAMVASVEFQEGAQLTLGPASSAQALMALLRNTVPARSRPVESFDTLSRVSGSAKAVCGVRGDARECADELVALLTADTRISTIDDSKRMTQYVG